MFVKKQIPRLCKLHSFYEEMPVDFSDKSDVDGSFNKASLTSRSPSFEKYVLKKSSNKKSFAIKWFQYCDLKTLQHHNLQGVVNISKKELRSLVDSLRIVLKAVDQASNSIQISLRKPKVEI